MLFQPTIMAKRVHDINLETIKSLGIKAIGLDADNTLTHDKGQEITPEMTAWIALMQQNGIKLLIVSNNIGSRLAPFAAKIGLEFIELAQKPLTIGLNAACKKMGVAKHQFLMVGDQIFTDVLSANFFGCHSALTEPYRPEANIFMVLKRKLEKPILRKIRKKAINL